MEEKKLYKAMTEMNPQIYKDFYKFYFRDHYKTFNIISTTIGILLLAAAVAMYCMKFGLVWVALALWIGIMGVIYPRVSYKKTYKRVKDTKQTTRFTFYEDYVTEKTSGETGDYKYSELVRAVETKNYIYLYHNENNISIVVKSEEKVNGAEGLCKLLRSKIQNYSIKKTLQ